MYVHVELPARVLNRCTHHDQNTEPCRYIGPYKVDLDLALVTLLIRAVLDNHSGLTQSVMHARHQSVTVEHR